MSRRRLAGMSLRDRVFDFVFYLFTGTLYAWALCRVILDATILDQPDSRLVLLCAGFLILLYAVLFNRYTAFVAAGTAALGGLLLWLSLWRQDFEAEWFLALRASLEELFRFARDQLFYKDSYDRIFGTAIAASIALVTALNLRLHFGFYTLTLVSVITVGLAIYMDWYVDVGVPHRAVLALLLCFVVLFAKKMNLLALAKTPRGAGGVSRNAGGNPTFSLLAVPVALAVVAVAWLLPKPDMDIGALEYQPGATPQDLTNIADNLLDSLGAGRSTVVYTEDGGRLGGSHTLSDKVVMEVRADARVYLTGSVRDRYTGSSWTTGEGGWEPLARDNLGNYASAEYAPDLAALQEYYMRFYGQPERLVEIVAATRTRTVFAPPYRHTLWFTRGDADIAVSRNPYGALTTDKTMPETTSYAQHSIGWDYENAYIVGLLRGAAATDADVPPGYLELPGGLPDRVRELAGEITAGCGSNYDKLRALERYLAQFPYTLEPESVPRGEDFVDYFLFTGQEGYCVYYASALAVMARCEGIPTRYVEGFVLPRERNTAGYFTVTGAQAHAWVEAWFPGFGWVPFEATPPNYNDLYSEAPAIPTEASAEPETGGGPDDETPPATTEPDSETGTARPGPTTPTDGADNGAGSGGWAVVAVLLVAVLLALLAGRGLRRRYRAYQREPDALEEPDAAVAWFGRLLGVATAHGYPLKQGETAHAWAERVGDWLPLPDGTTALELAEIFARAAYSQAKISPVEVQLLERCHRHLLERLRGAKTGRLRHCVERYLLLRY